MDKLKVVYTCGFCNVRDATVDVPVRGSNEDVIDWMRNLTLLLQKHHGRKSPRCIAREFKSVLIPMSSVSDRVGGEVAH